MKKVVNVRDRYHNELQDIDYILRNLENGRYYENSGAKMDGRISTNIEKLREYLKELIDKIEYNKESQFEGLAKAIENIYK